MVLYGLFTCLIAVVHGLIIGHIQNPAIDIDISTPLLNESETNAFSILDIEKKKHPEIIFREVSSVHYFRVQGWLL